MRIETTKDILEHSRKFHKIIAEYYRKLSESSDKERVKLLLNYLEERESKIEETLEELEVTISPNVLNSWFSHSQCKNKLDELAQLVKKETTSVPEIIDIFVHLDDCLIDLYTKIVHNAENVEVQEFFKSLSKIQENHKLKSLLNAAQIDEI